jgi:hypothetical protein
MARDVEFLMPPELQRLGGPMVDPLQVAADAAGFRTYRTEQYRGGSEWLVLYGYGAPNQAAARTAHRKAGGQAILWDLGYFKRGYRTSINHDHPQALLDRAPSGGRLSQWGIELREDADPAGPIILVGLGPKSRRYLGAQVDGWEERKLRELTERFPDLEVIFRPKPRGPFRPLPCRTDEHSKIDDLLRGASLVVCRHSNVAVDAVVTGVPFECEDGAACWLVGRPYTREARREFLERLSWFNWRTDEPAQAWQFVSTLASGANACV